MIATCFALIGFAAALWVGYLAGNTMQVILLRALFTMFVCLVVGLGVGTIAERVLETEIIAYKEKYPIPGDEDATAAPTTGGDHPDSVARTADAAPASPRPGG